MSCRATNLILQCFQRILENSSPKCRIKSIKTRLKKEGLCQIKHCKSWLGILIKLYKKHHKMRKKKQVSLTGCLMISGKPHFRPGLGLLDPNLGHRFFFEVSALLDVRHCSKLQSCTISRKSNDANLRKWQKPNFEPNFGPPKFFFLSFNYTSS